MGRTAEASSRGTFPRQAIAMVWDYVETDPFHVDGGIWDAHTRWIELAIRHCSAVGATSQLRRCAATLRSFRSRTDSSMP